MTKIDSDTAKKILKSKEEKCEIISNILNGEKHHTDKGYEVDSLDKLKDNKDRNNVQQ